MSQTKEKETIYDVTLIPGDGIGPEVTEAADLVEGAIAEVIAEGKSVTYDLKPHRDDPATVGTSQVADAVIEKMRRGTNA